MTPFRTHRGVVAPLDRVHVDTDAIIPKQFLKRIERSGFGEFLFFDWRFLDNGQPNLEFVLNRAPFDRATILLARANFGCGSSREHAPWALADFGFRAILAPSFADIFFNNCFKNGMLPIVLNDAVIDDLFRRVTSAPGFELEIDLEAQQVRGEGVEISFDVDPFRRECLLEGLDDIGLTLRHVDKIAAYEAAHPPLV